MPMSRSPLSMAVFECAGEDENELESCLFGGRVFDLLFRLSLDIRGALL